jgi:hypothetical protein
VTNKKNSYILFYESCHFHNSKTSKILKPKGKTKSHFICMVDNVPTKNKTQGGRNMMLLDYILRIGLNYLTSKER